jgi:hypothetical protein
MALKQRRSEFALQRLNMAIDCRAMHTERLGGGADRAKTR